MNRQDLIDFRDNQESIKARLDLIKEMKTLLTSITPKYEDMPKSNKKIQDTTAEKIVQIIDMENEYLEHVKIKNRTQKLILKKLDNVKQPYRTILDKVYILGKDLVTVASEKKYSYKYICNLHGQALLEFDKICEKVDKCG